MYIVLCVAIDCWVQSMKCNYAVLWPSCAYKLCVCPYTKDGVGFCTVSWVSRQRVHQSVSGKGESEQVP